MRDPLALSTNPSRRQSLIRYGIAALVVLVMISLLTDVIPPETLAANRLEFTKIRIIEYAVENHKLPASLADLSTPPPNKDYKTVDTRGTPFVYSPRPDGSFTLRRADKDSTSDAYIMGFPIADVRKEDAIQSYMILGSLKNVADEIGRYASARGRLPNDLAEMQGADLDSGLILPVDWCGPLSYRVTTGGTIILSRPGKWGPDKVYSVEFSIPGMYASEPTTAAGGQN
jgi:hypothetical protein